MSSYPKPFPGFNSELANWSQSMVSNLTSFTKLLLQVARCELIYLFCGDWTWDESEGAGGGGLYSLYNVYWPA